MKQFKKALNYSALPQFVLKNLQGESDKNNTDDWRKI